MNKNDKHTTIQELKELAQQMASEREWGPFHSPKNLSMSLNIEASELMEIYRWSTTDGSYQDTEDNRQEVEHEAADVLIALLLFCNATNINLAQATLNKLEEIKSKYPIEKAKGRCEKYTKL